MAGELAAAVDARPGWTMQAGIAKFVTESGWSASVREAAIVARARERWHVAVADPSGRAQYVMLLWSAVEAVRKAEAQVRSRNRGVRSQPP